MIAEPAPRNGCPLCSTLAHEDLWGCVVQNKQWRLHRCSACGLHYTFPLPTTGDIVSFYDKHTYHSDLLEEDGAEVRTFGRKFRRYLRSVQPHRACGRWLDIGCSTGLFPRLLTRYGYDAEGLEVNPRTAEWGRQHYGVRIHVGTFEDFVPSGLYDVVSLTDVLEHTQNPMATLGRINGFLSEGGIALITVPDIRGLKSRFYFRLARLLRRDWIWSTCHAPGHTWEFTEPVARACFEKSGFRVVGFGRTDAGGDNPSGRLAPLGWLMLPFRVWPLAKRFGTQMEFVLRKTTPARLRNGRDRPGDPQSRA